MMSSGSHDPFVPMDPELQALLRPLQENACRRAAKGLPPDSDHGLLPLGGLEAHVGQCRPMLKLHSSVRLSRSQWDRNGPELQGTGMHGAGGGLSGSEPGRTENREGQSSARRLSDDPGSLEQAAG